MPALSNFDDFIYGPDNEKPMYELLEEVLGQAKADGVRLQIDVRLQADGVPASRNEHQFAVDPESVDPDRIMTVLHKRLSESPGETYCGQVRLNFGQAGSGNSRYRSYTRIVRHSQPSTQDSSFGMMGRRFSGGFGGGGFGGGGFRRPSTPVPDSDDDVGVEEIDNTAADALNDNYDPPSSNYSEPSGYSQEDIVQAQMAQMALQQQMQQGPVTHEQFAMWTDTTMGMMFRSLSQQMTMFERVIGFMDSVTVRYGLPHPEEPSIVEARGPRGNSPGGGMQGALGLLPTLLNAAASLAQAKDPGEVAERAVDMAHGNPPPRGAARQAAIRGAAGLVRQLPRGSQQSPPPASFAPRGPSPHQPDHGGGGAFFDEDGYPPEPDIGYDSPDEGVPYNHSAEDYDPSPVAPSGPPDLRGLSPDEVKNVFVDWIRDDPDNKDAVMGMLPELSKEIM